MTGWWLSNPKRLKWVEHVFKKNETTNQIPSSKAHRPCQIGVGRLVSMKNWWFSGSMFIYQRVSSCNLNLPIFGVCPESHVGLGQQLLRFEEFHHTLSCVRPHPTGLFSPIGEPWRMPFMWNKACFDHGTYQILGSRTLQVFSFNIPTAALNCMVSCNHCNWRNSSGYLLVVSFILFLAPVL